MSRNRWAAVVGFILIAVLFITSIAAGAQLRNVEWEPMNVEFSEGGNLFSRAASSQIDSGNAHENAIYPWEREVGS